MAGKKSDRKSVGAKAAADMPAAGGMGFRGRLILLGVMVVALTAAFAPWYQFYLAYVSVAPLMILLAGVKSKRAAFLWGWGAGTVFFAANMWWLVFVSGPGMAALAIYMGLYWGFCAMVWRGCGLLIEPGKVYARGRLLRNVVLAPVVWCAFEWLRGNWSLIGNHGLPWLLVGYTQTPFLAVCQIADVTGVVGVSYVVVAVNAVVAAAIVMGWPARRNWMPAAVTAAGVLIATGVYGAWRISETRTVAGPRVLVIQPNYPQSNSGEKGAPLSEIIDFHLKETEEALKTGERVDLVAWSETMMPPMNEAAIEELRQYPGMFPEALGRLEEMCKREHVALLAGGTYAGEWRVRGEEIIPTDHRNCAYYFDRDGNFSELRQDKIELVPFGEFIPFAGTPLHALFVKFGPDYYEDYELKAGREIVRYPLEAAGRETHFVVPICFEDIVGSAVARMVGGWTGKRADFIINITNDGWFRASEMPQHLQAATFRSIENRVPTARSVNTGISGFVDSVGRVSDTVAAGTEGWSAHQLMLDERETVYMRVGDAFAELCAIGTGMMVVVAMGRKNRKQQAN